MPTYEYRNAAGKHFEIFAAMSKMPPPEIFVFPDGVWQDATSEITGTFTDPETGATGLRRARYLAELPAPERQFTRQITGGGGIMVPDYCPKPNAQGLPVSRAAPRIKGGERRKVGEHIIREHPCGTMTNDAGQPIIQNNASASDIAKRTGMEID